MTSTSERDVQVAEPAADAHQAIDAAYHAKYDRYGPQIVGTRLRSPAHRASRVRELDAMAVLRVRCYRHLD